MFADWGEPVVLKHITQVANPSTGTLSESESNVVMKAIVKPRATRPTSGAARQHSAITTTFLVRSEELPEAFNVSMCRIVHNDLQYSVIGSEAAGDGLTVTILGQRV
jgi:hypothetical protein